MTGFLQVIPSFLKQLAGIHSGLVPEVQKGTAIAKPLPSSVSQTHGTASQSSNTAVQEFVTVRSALGEGMGQVEQGLSMNLFKGSDAYEGTDSGHAGVLSKLLGQFS